MPSAVPSAFGKYLRQQRKAARLSQTELGQAIGLSHEYLSQVERGTRPPLEPEHWPALVKALPGVTTADLQRFAAMSRPLEIDLAGAPPEEVDLALTIALRIRNHDLSADESAALLDLAKSGGGSAVRAHGRVIDAQGAPVSGRAFIYRLGSTRGWSGVVGVRAFAGRALEPVDGRTAINTGKTIDLLSASDPRGAGFFDVPGGLSPGEYALDVHHAAPQPLGGTATAEEWAWPLTVTDGQAPQDVRIVCATSAPTPAAPAEPDNPPPPPPTGPRPPAPALAKQFTSGTFTASFSYYGLGGAPLDRIQRDLDRFRRAGFASARVWTDWERPTPACRFFNRDGSPVSDQIRKLEASLDFAVTLGMTFDLTMAAGHYDRTKRSDKQDGETGYDITPHKNALQFLVSHFKGHPGIALIDAGNECNERGPGGSGDPQYGHVSPGRAKELFDLARAADPARRVTFSITGDAKTCSDAYESILERGTPLPIFLPHFPRDSGWGASEGPRSSDLRKSLTAAKSSSLVSPLLIHHQEPARRNYPNPGQNMWPTSEFEASFRTTRAAGAVGCCFHTGACFDLTNGDGWDQLDDVERDVAAHVAGWIK